MSKIGKKIGKSVSGRSCPECGRRTDGIHCAPRVPGPSVTSELHPSNNGSWARFIRAWRVS